jgi:hypothetical protein
MVEVVHYYLHMMSVLWVVLVRNVFAPNPRHTPLVQLHFHDGFVAENNREAKRVVYLVLAEFDPRVLMMLLEVRCGNRFVEVIMAFDAGVMDRTER